jgi:hypothetical protein
MGSCCAPHGTRGARADLVDAPVTFDAVGGGGRLVARGGTLRSAHAHTAAGVADDAEGGGRGWATLGRAIDQGTLVWRFRVESHSLSFGLVAGTAPVPDGWEDENPRGYEIWNGSNGFVRVLGRTRYNIPRHWRRAPLLCEVECTLDMDARTMAFTVSGGGRRCVVFRGIDGPVRPIIWGGHATLLRVRATADAAAGVRRAAAAAAACISRCAAAARAGCWVAAVAPACSFD